MSEYTVEVDPLHRNVWPVTWHGREIGQLTEHITIALDGTEPPSTRWSWKLIISEGDGLLAGESSVGTKARFTTHGDALATLAQVHHAIYCTGTRESKS
jgi:hypothetical protein